MSEIDSFLNVYLVRHGRSDARDGDRRQAPNSPLGDEGRRQASALAERMAKEKVDIIISSKWDRAFQTAEIVADKLGMKVETYEGIHEKEQSPELYGAELGGDLQKRYKDEVEQYGHDLDWKFDGKGESLRDLVKRVSDFQRYILENHKDRSVLVVTHGLFIRTFVIFSLLGENYDDKTFYTLFTRTSFDNTGISLLEFSSKKNHWELRYLNDHLHMKG